MFVSTNKNGIMYLAYNRPSLSDGNCTSATFAFVVTDPDESAGSCMSFL